MKGSERGAALMMVLWMLLLLSVFVINISHNTTQELVVSRWVRDQVMGRALALAGIERGLQELQADQEINFDASTETWASNEKAFREIPLEGGTFTVLCDPAYRLNETPDSGDLEGLSTSRVKTRYGLCDESARINLNKADQPTLLRLFLAANPKMDPTTANAIAQSIIDWRDTDDATMQQGAETTYYKLLSKPYEARNGPLESVEELQMIKGITREIYESVSPYVTVYTKGKVNFNTASKVVLQALGLQADLAQKVLEFRKGTDSVEGTEDDQIFQVPEAITPALSTAGTFSSENFAEISNAIASGAIDVNSQFFRIQSIGRLISNGAPLETGVTCVVRRDGRVLYWREGDE